MTQLSLDKALRQFEITEANLEKVRRLLKTASDNPNHARDAYAIWEVLPRIDGWKTDIRIYDSNEVQLMRIDAHEVGEPGAFVAVENEIASAAELLDEYAYRLTHKRLTLIRRRVLQLVSIVDEQVASLKSKVDAGAENYDEEYEPLHKAVEEVDTLLGSAFQRPPRWNDLRRHLGFWENCDVHDIINHDWPTVRPVLTEQLYTENEPIQTEVDDLGALAASAPEGPVTTRLSWEQLDAETFERLIFNIIAGETVYKDPQWLMRTNAPDRGRDLSVSRVYEDALSGTMRQRVIIQCKHWTNKSISADEIAALKEKVKLWEPPTVDYVIIATSGRFTSDAVALIEKQNQSGHSPRIDMWPESHLEMLLARRPALIAEFRLRGNS
ncbi:restriction endonuclease [Parvibaculum sp.]|uniref:restriction endonuclease n=1 Tax=Parvibaculum sp. TaxID=2024848 RepID=UPI0032987F5E